VADGIGDDARMAESRRIVELIGPSVEAMGYDVVRVQMMGGARPVLQVMVERRDDQAMTVEDCAEVSRTVSAILDVDDPIQGAYALEVTSPGIDRPLTRPKDFDRFAGFEARVEMASPVDGRKRFRGRLAGVADGKVRLIMPEGEAALPLDDIQKAKLVLTDELLAAAAGSSMQ